MNVHGRPVDVWSGRFTRPVERYYRVSLCTACMGRLHDLRQTLQKNIAANADYPSVEFVLLDYNSADGLEKWVADNLLGDVESGRLVYARTTQPRWFHMAHSRNVAFKLATGDIVCNVDADNWIGPGFAAALNRLANDRPERAVFARGCRLLRGRIGFFKREWLDLLGGYDENMQNYGHEDVDIFHRALLQGFRLMVFEPKHITRLHTGGAAKVANMEVKNWRATEAAGRARSAANIARGILRSNEDRKWGVATLRKNFKEDVVL